MPAWATVVITLGASLLTGTSALAVAWLKSRTDRRDGWHTRQTEAASQFAMRFIGAADAARYSLDNPDDQTAVHNAVHLAGEVTPLLGPVSLLFGSGSTAAESSTGAVEQLKLAAEQLESGDRDTARTTLSQATLLRASFEDAVRAEVGG